MDIEQLKQLETIERLGTFSAAAEWLHISQPALSRSIKRLETDLGYTLFDRTKNSVSINKAGKLAAQHARIIVSEERSLRNALDDLSRQARTMRVGTCAPAPLWRLTARIVERFPGRLLSSETLDDRSIEAALMDRSIDLGITHYPLALPNVRSIPFMTEALSISVPNSHPFAQRKAIELKELAGQRILLYKNIGFWLDMVKEHIPNAEFVYQHDYRVFQELTRSTDALFFVTDAPSLAIEAPNRTIVALIDSCARATYYLISRTDCDQMASEVTDWIAKTS